MTPSSLTWPQHSPVWQRYSCPLADPDASTVWLAAVYLTAFIPANITHPQYGPPRQTPGRVMSACRKSLFDTLRHFSDLQKALKNADHPRAGHPSRVSRTHPSAPLTKGSRSFGRPRNRRISCGGFFHIRRGGAHTLSVKGRDALCGEKSYCCAVARCC